MQQSHLTDIHMPLAASHVWLDCGDVDVSHGLHLDMGPTAVACSCVPLLSTHIAEPAFTRTEIEHAQNAR